MVKLGFIGEGAVEIELENGEKKYIKIGLKDYEKVEVISGIDKTDKIIIPAN